MAAQVTGAGVYHYNTDYSNNAYSDHDPYLVGLNLDRNVVIEEDTTINNDTIVNNDTTIITIDTTGCKTVQMTYNVSYDGGFRTYNVEGKTTWEFTAFGAEINAYNENNFNEDWLISPSIDLTVFDDTVTANYQTYNKYMNGDYDYFLSMWMSTDYRDGSHPSEATWTPLPTSHPGLKTYFYIQVNIPDSLKTDNVHFAFKYSCDDKYSASHWQVNGFYLQGKQCKASIVVNDMEGMPTAKQFFVINHYIYSTVNDLTGVKVYSATGQLFSAEAYLPDGLYIITDGKNTQKVIVR